MEAIESTDILFARSLEDLVRAAYARLILDGGYGLLPQIDAPVPLDILECIMKQHGDLKYGPVRTLVRDAVYDCAVKLHTAGTIKLQVYQCPYCKTVEIPFASNLDDDSFWESHETFGIRRCVEPGMVELCASCAHFEWPGPAAHDGRIGSGRCQLESPGGGGYDNCCQPTNGCRRWKHHRAV